MYILETHLTSPDKREGFMWRYSPSNDPSPKDPSSIPPRVAAHLMSEDFMWAGTSHLPGFYAASMTYWQQSLTLSRKLIRVIALSLALPETYFDKYATYPGADGSYNYYPPLTTAAARDSSDVSLGAHTDVQVFTLVVPGVPGEHGPLQVLDPKGQWLEVPRIKGTVVVNVGDFLMRISNGRYKSTVHRVADTQGMERFSLAFFFGFNLDERVEVVSTCVEKGEKPKYGPITAAEMSI